MESERRRRRQSSTKPKSKRTPSTSRSRKPAPAAVGPTTVNDLPDHLLELILLCVHSSACLLRAVATCKRWRRLVAEPWFLTRFRSIHDADAPCVAGNYHAVDPDWVEDGAPPVTGNPAFVPSSSIAVDRRHFSLDFLPDSETGWEIADSRGSLLLLFKRRTTRSWGSGARRWSHFCLPDLVVCEPLTRRHQGVLRPADTATCCLGVFLLDGDQVDTTGGRVGMSNFRIVAVLNECNALAEPRRGRPVACVFSLSPASDDDDGGGWRVMPNAPTRTGVDVSIPDPYEIDSISFVGRTKGFIYWVVTGEDRAVLAFDEDTAEFSRFLFPAGSIIWGPFVDRRNFRVIGGEDGALRVVRVIGNDLKVFVQVRPGGDEWVVEKFVRLPEATSRLPGREERYYHFHCEAMIVAGNEKYVLMTPQGKTWLFSVELETMEAEREHERNKYPGEAYPCALPWPPVLSVCVDHGNRRKSKSHSH